LTSVLAALLPAPFMERITTTRRFRTHPGSQNSKIR
jgi:hypothetical protein